MPGFGIGGTIIGGSLHAGLGAGGGGQQAADAPPIQVPLINGVLWSFAHIGLGIANLPFTGGFKAIKYSRKRNREIGYSNSPDPIGKTLGQNEYMCSVEVYLEWWRALLTTVQAIGAGYGDQPFPIQVNYSANGYDIIKDTIQNCTFDTTDADNSVGTGALVRTIEFNPTKIFFNGIDDLSNPLVASPQ